tara:strand:+ start:934 stop:1551 length:618 start_codon:yes stop_codon:yes gene_type:complete
MALTFDGSTNTISGLVINSTNITDGSIVNADISASAAIASTKLSGLTSGITEVDEWRFNSYFTRQSTADITANWERADTIFSKVGTGMTESSGIFTFPSTGIWLVDMQINTFSQNGLSSWIELTMAYSTDGGSNYTTDKVFSYDHVEYQMGYYAYNTQQTQGIIDVTNTSNWRVKFRCGAGNNSLRFLGGENKGNSFRFIRLGDT